MTGDPRVTGPPAETPKVLLGEFTGRRTARLRELGWGRMWVARKRRVVTYPGEPWGFDNGAYSDYLAGRPFGAAEYEKRVGLLHAVTEPPYLAVLPDVVAGGLKSLQLSLWWLAVLPPWPWYLAVQDGMTPRDVAPHVARFAGLFLGGTDRFKATARQWRALAHEHGLRFHYGRAGTPAKLQHAVEVRADSLDSTFPMWTNARWSWFEHLVLHGHPQQRLALA